MRLVNVEPEQTASPESWAVIHAPVKQESVQDSFQGAAGIRIPVRQQHVQAGVHRLREEVAGVPRRLQGSQTVHDRKHLSRTQWQVITDTRMMYRFNLIVELHGSSRKTDIDLQMECRADRSSSARCLGGCRSPGHLIAEAARRRLQQAPPPNGSWHRHRHPLAGHLQHGAACVPQPDHLT